MSQKEKDEYYFLTERLEETQWTIEGKCNDIDCDKYMYRDLLKKKYKPVLKHSFSCLSKLKMERDAILRLLSDKKYKRYRYLKCNVCKKNLDKLNDSNIIVSFTRPSKERGKYYEWKGFWAHKKCKSKIKIPKGWNKF